MVSGPCPAPRDDQTAGLVVPMLLRSAAYCGLLYHRASVPRTSAPWNIGTSVPKILHPFAHPILGTGVPWDFRSKDQLAPQHRGTFAPMPIGSNVPMAQ